MVSNTLNKKHRGSDYGASNDDEYSAPEVQLIDFSNGSMMNQGGKAHSSLDQHDEEKLPNLILSNDDEFGFVFKPEGLPGSTGKFTSDNPPSVVITAVVCTSLTLIIAIAIVVYKKRKATSKQEARVKWMIARNLETFERGDVVVNSAPTGGYHGFYADLQKVKNRDSSNTTERTHHTVSEHSQDDDDSLDEECLGDSLLASFLSPVEFGDNKQESYSNDFELTTRSNHAASFPSRDII